MRRSQKAFAFGHRGGDFTMVRPRRAIEASSSAEKIESRSWSRCVCRAGSRA